VFTNLTAVRQSTAEGVQGLPKAYRNEERLENTGLVRILQNVLMESKSREAVLREELLSPQSQAAQGAQSVESAKISPTRSRSSAQELTKHSSN